MLTDNRTSESIRWHERLGHINLETINLMVQRELVVGIPQVTSEKRVCSSCFLGNKREEISLKP